MQYDQFIGQVQDKARLATRGEALQATRATLESLAQRLVDDEAAHLAAQLPHELQAYLRGQETAQRFDLNEFFKRVSQREGVDLPQSTHHARAVIAMLDEAVSHGEMQDVRAQLPDDFEPLFVSGSEGELH